jgi:hypothetical protein
MKQTTKNLSLLAAVALTVGPSVHATAQSVSAGQGDLILGFNVQPGGTNAGVSDLEVNLGSLSLYTTTASFTLSTTGTATAGAPLSVADLVATYGSNWNSSTSGLTWGLLGSADGTSTFVAGSTSPQSNNSNESTPASDGTSIANQLNGSAATANSAYSSVLGTSAAPAIGAPNTWGNLVNESTGGAYGFFSNPTVVEVNGGIGNPVGSLELISYAPYANSTHPPAHYGTPTGTELGTFSLDAAGDLTFTGSAVAAPEPSTYALMAGAMGLLFLAVRRRQFNV